MIITKKSKFMKYASWVLVLGIAVGCGNDGDDDEETTADTTSTAGTPYAPGSTSTASGSSIAGGALNLSAMPTISDIVSTSSSPLNIAVSGTPPKFSDLSSSNLETYLTGSVSTMISNITTEAAKASPNWTVVQGYVDTFRQGQTKCRIMEHAARQIDELSSRTNSSCYMKEIDKPSNSLLEWVEGNNQIAAGAFFTAPAGTTAANPIIREIHMEAQGDLPEQRIRFRISNDANIYTVKLTFCQNGSAGGSDLIEVNSNTGSESMTYTTYHAGSDSFGGETQTYEFSSVIRATIASAVDSAGGVNLVFDKSQPRTMESRGSMSSGSFQHSFNGSLLVSGDQLTNKFVMSGAHTFNNKTFTNDVRSYSKVRFSGDSSSSVAVYEGAGRTIGSFKDPDQSSAQSFDEQVGFEFQDTSSPQFATVTSSTYINDVAAIDFGTDSLLLNTTPLGVDAAIKALSADSDCAGSVADGTVEAVYRIGGVPADMAAIDAKCENHFDGGSDICNALSQQEQSVFSALRQKAAAGQ